MNTCERGEGQEDCKQHNITSAKYLPRHHSVLFYGPLYAFPSAYHIITLGMKVSRLCLLLLVIGLTYST